MILAMKRRESFQIDNLQEIISKYAEYYNNEGKEKL
jgi:hypothetical protein